MVAIIKLIKYYTACFRTPFSNWRFTVKVEWINIVHTTVDIPTSKEVITSTFVDATATLSRHTQAPQSYEITYLGLHLDSQLNREEGNGWVVAL